MACGYAVSQLFGLTAVNLRFFDTGIYAYERDR